MSRYSGQASATATDDEPIFDLKTDGTVKPRIYDLVVGYESAPADQASEVSVRRTTTAGTTPTAGNSEPLDPSSVAASATFNIQTWAADPTDDVDSLLRIPLHQRATFRWVAFPDGELISSDTAANGLMLLVVSITSGTPIIGATVHWVE